MSTEFQDRTLTCVDCGGDFTWSAGEQEYFRDKGFTVEPKRCKPCRQAKKDRRGDFDKKKDGKS